MKVLILAYDFPPLISIGGQRPYSWYKYLPANGFEVTVVTRHWSKEISSPLDYVKATGKGVVFENDEHGNKVIKTDFRPNLRDRILLKYGLTEFALFRKVLSFLYSFLEHLFWAFDSKAAIYFEAEKQIEQSKPDLIIATGEPFMLFKYGHKLSEKYGIPWIADYRDGWTSNQGNYSRGTLSSLQSRFFRLVEKNYVSTAIAVTTASPTYASELAKIHPEKNIKLVYNGYDDAYFQNLDAVQLPANKFIISYAGTVYPHQNLEMFLDGLAKFLMDGNILPGTVELRFFGIESQAQALQRLLDYRPDLKPFIITQPKIPYAELIKQLRASHLLLLLSKSGANWLNAKIFDYLGVNRKIILVENDHGIMENLLKDNAGGKAANNVDEVSEILDREYANFRSGKVVETELPESAKQYTRKNQARVLAEFLKNMIGRSVSP